MNLANTELTYHYLFVCLFVVISLYLPQVTDFTWPGKILCILFCYVGIALYAIPAGTLFDKFGGVLGLDGNDEDDEEEE